MTFVFMARINPSLAIAIGISLLLGWQNALPLGAQESIPTTEAIHNTLRSHAARTPGLQDIEQWGLAPGTLDRLHAPVLRRDLKLTTAQSCATSTCHGGPIPSIAEPQAMRGSEYQLWKEFDPHARSWRTICGEKSVAMMKRLQILNQQNEIVDQQGFDNCLACHNTAPRFAEQRASHQIQEGVGCNACHGPAEKWINRHYQHDWSKTIADKDGFVHTQDVYIRARMCASCHVGDKDRDMNHDMIAAGHPQLQFEMATFQNRQPKHWRDLRAQEPHIYEGQLWLAGQLAAADAALALLESRAGGVNGAHQWPELATFDCASCHHTLGLDNQRTMTANGKATLSQWNFSGLSWLLDFRDNTGSGTKADRDLSLVLRKVAQHVEAGIQTDRKGIARVAAKGRRLLGQWYMTPGGINERQSFNTERLADLVAYIAPRPGAYATWESATQLYLAAVASSPSWPEDAEDTMKNIAKEMRRGLAYPPAIDISRMAKRRSPDGGPATRKALLELGTDLSTLITQDRLSSNAAGSSSNHRTTRSVVHGKPDKPFDQPQERSLISPAQDAKEDAKQQQLVKAESIAPQLNAETPPYAPR